MKKYYCLLLIVLVFTGLFISCEGEVHRVYSCVDYDKNSYKTVIIGNQVWMAENLSAIHATDGGKNYLTIELADWVNKDVERRFVLDNDTTYRRIYGYMYNYRAIETGKLAPRNWRIPSKEDWETLFAHVNAQTNGLAGKALASNTIWNQSSLIGSVGNNLSANNSTGFNALPGGIRTENEVYLKEKNRACFWTSTLDSTTNRPLVVYIDYNSIEFKVDTFMTNEEACYIRCVRDVE
jgi:uncharacterized protein (TIGR02145 family)